MNVEGLQLPRGFWKLKGWLATFPRLQSLAVAQQPQEFMCSCNAAYSVAPASMSQPAWVENNCFFLKCIWIKYVQTFSCSYSLAYAV